MDADEAIARAQASDPAARILVSPVMTSIDGRELAGFQEWFYDTPDAVAPILVAALERLMAKRDSKAEQIRARLPGLIRGAARNFSVIRAVLSR